MIAYRLSRVFHLISFHVTRCAGEKLYTSLQIKRHVKLQLN